MTRQEVDKMIQESQNKYDVVTEFCLETNLVGNCE